MVVQQRLRAGPTDRRAAKERSFEHRIERLASFDPLGCGRHVVQRRMASLAGYVDVGAALEVERANAIGSGLEQVGELVELAVRLPELVVDEPTSPRVRHRVVDAQRQSAAARGVLLPDPQRQFGLVHRDGTVALLVRACVGERDPSGIVVEAAADDRIEFAGHPDPHEHGVRFRSHRRSCDAGGLR